jgi:hypothetical protein
VTANAEHNFRSSRRLFEAGPVTAIDGTSQTQTIVTERLTDDKAIVRYQNHFDGAVIEFRVAERMPGSNAITMHDANSMTRSGSDELQTPNSALANVGNNHVVSCELESEAKTDFSIKCALISFDDTSKSLSVGSWSILKQGSFPSFPESIFLARLRSGKALACFQIEHWEQVSTTTSSRKDKVACRDITVIDSRLEFGTEIELSSDSSDDLAMAEFDENKVLACYSAKGTNNYCRMLADENGQIMAGNTVDLKERAGTYTARPCVVSRLAQKQALACCERPSWIPLRNYLECSVLFVSNTNDLSLSGDGSFGSTSLTVQSGFGRAAPEKMVHLKDENKGAFGKTEICYQALGDDQTKLTCDTLQVKESWSWTSFAYQKYLKIKSQDRYEFTDLDGTYVGRFFSLERMKVANPADLLSCYRTKAGPGQCKMLTR